MTNKILYDYIETIKRAYENNQNISTQEMPTPFHDCFYLAAIGAFAAFVPFDNNNNHNTRTRFFCGAGVSFVSEFLFPLAIIHLKCFSTIKKTLWCVI